MIVLGIESSCDETGVALYDTEKGELAHHIYSQIMLHRQYGGVVPELASRDHINRCIGLIDNCIKDAKIEKKDISVIAHTAGPGLLGALLSGSCIAKSLAFSLGIPSLEIHHMEGHLLAALLDKNNPPSFPFLSLLVSGGHTMLISVKAIGSYEVLGTTLDDAVGEAFDKTAKLLGLPYSGGIELEKLAEKGNPNSFELSRPMMTKPGLNFSFSGLKTQVRLLIESNGEDKYSDIAASFQEAAIDTLYLKCRRAIRQNKYKSLVVAGGVAANKLLRVKLEKLCKDNNISFHIPEHKLCTDNGLMIAYAGAIRIKQAEKNYSINCKSRWDLSELIKVD